MVCFGEGTQDVLFCVDEENGPPLGHIIHSQ